jgi:DNA polymerase-3 subunit gamma/tau
MALGVAGADILTRVIDSIANNKPADAIAVVDDIVMRGHDLRSFCRDLLAHFRDLLVTKVSGNEELLEAAVCEPVELKRQADLFSESDLVRFFHSLAETETKLRTATQPRYQVEIGIVKLMELRGVESISEILQRLANLEGSSSGKPGGGSSSSGNGSPAPRKGGAGQINSGSRAASSSFSAAAVAPAFEMKTEVTVQSTAGIDEPATTDDGITTSSEMTVMDRIKAALENQRKMLLVTVLEAAHAASIEDGELFVEFTPESRHFRDTLTKAENIKILREVCREVTGQDAGVRIAVRDLQEQSSGPATREDDERIEKKKLRESAESNPIVQEMMRTFRGEIVDVRRIDGK